MNQRIIFTSFTILSFLIQSNFVFADEGNQSSGALALKILEEKVLINDQAKPILPDGDLEMDWFRLGYSRYGSDRPRGSGR